MTPTANWICPQCGGFSMSERSSGPWLFVLGECAGFVIFVIAMLSPPPWPIWSWALITAAFILCSIALWHGFRGRVRLSCAKCGHVVTVDLNKREGEISPSESSGQRGEPTSGP